MTLIDLTSPPAVLILSIRLILAMGLLFVALDARGKATKGEPVAAKVGRLRADEAGVEAQVVASGIS